MILKLFKPSWRKLMVAAGLYVMVGLSSGVHRAVNEIARQDLAASTLGQRYTEEIKRIYQDVHCEAREQALEAANQLISDVKDQDMAVSVELRSSITYWLGTTVLVVICYLLACIACTGAVIRFREKPDSN